MGVLKHRKSNGERTQSENKYMTPSDAYPNRLGLLVTDIDGTLIHDQDNAQPGLAQLSDFLASRQGRFLFAVATGRRLALVQDVFQKFALPDPDIVISSVGTAIFYRLDGSQPDTEWAQHLDHEWDADAVRHLASSAPGLRLQHAPSQGPFKVSFLVDGAQFNLTGLHSALGDWLLKINVILTQNKLLDLLPRRASKGHAIRFLARKLALPLEQVLVCGDSGNDIDMLQTTGRALVVGNYSPELEGLRTSPGIYFSREPAAAGILDGLRHYGFADPEPLTGIGRSPQHQRIALH